MSKFFAHDNPFDVYMTPLSNDNPVGEWVKFPTTAEVLRDVFLRLGIGPSGWAIAEVADYVDGIHPTIEGCQNLDELNYLAVKLDRMRERDVEHFRVLTSMDIHNDTVAELINLCDNPDNYEFYPDLYDDTDIGRYWAYHESGFDSNMLDAMEDYIDFEAYGTNIRRNGNGIQADNCYIVPYENAFTEYYHGEIGYIPEDAVVTKLIYIPLLNEDERLERAIELAEYKAGIRYDPEQDREPEKLTVLVAEPLKEPYTKEISTGLSALQAEVGGDIQAVYPYEDAVAPVCNEEGKLEGLPLNRALRDEDSDVYDIVAGTFIVVGLGDETLPPFLLSLRRNIRNSSKCRSSLFR